MLVYFALLFEKLLEKMVMNASQCLKPIHENSHFTWAFRTEIDREIGVLFPGMNAIFPRASQ